MKKIAKIIGLTLFFCLLAKACNMEYNSDMIATMPNSVYEKITEEHPDYSEAEIVDEYIENYLKK